MDFQHLIDNITPTIYQSLRRAVELGRWPDGNGLTKEQLELCMQAVIAWEHKNVPAKERTGYIPPKEHSHCGGEGDIAEPQTIKWENKVNN